MHEIEDKYIEQLKEEIIKNLRLDFFDDEEIKAILRDLTSFDKKIRQKAVALCQTLSHKSSSLVPTTIKRVKNASRFLVPREMEKWINHAYDLLDHQGVDPFLGFISRMDAETLWNFLMPKGLSLQEVTPFLETYLRGISGLELKVMPNKESFTNTSTIYLPPFIDKYEEHDKNLLVYKFMAAHKWAQIVQGTLTPDAATLKTFLKDDATAHPDIETFFSLFPERELAIDLYNIIEAFRLESFLKNELPGLMRGVCNIKKDFIKFRAPLSSLSEKAAFVELLYQSYLRAETETSFLNKEIGEILYLKEDAGNHESMTALFKLYNMATKLAGVYQPRSYLLLLGAIRPEDISLHLKEERRAHKKRLEGFVTKIINMPSFAPQKMSAHKTLFRDRMADPAKEYLLIKGRIIDLDTETKDFISEKGGIPGGVMVKGADIGGAGSPITLTELMEEEEIFQETTGGIKYDEWDYNRGGYKKKWCTLYEHNIHPGHDSFVEQTLRRYSGQVNILRKKFELLNREPKIIRRQKDGEDIDIDAVVDAFSDIHAGLSPSENYFTKYDRQQRNLAVLFLIDMSGSTKGWVNEAERESLILMAEALEALGDRYAVYGFSGMTRNKCDYYCVKSFDESYSDTVKRRISGIVSKDYTRMGPPIRHSISLLKSVDARTKLLITLSDGKPEDYDAYKGNYGIEDTRKALIEAKEFGIHSFCITIDREASSYLKRMYGEVNYTVIDDVRKLPHRITEIYRRLAT
ncbi:MAG: hypothetical protein HY808_10805 [Nitrospirae bacterium]|nr:hypothetical protein [Nitrospirota bacterium]